MNTNYTNMKTMNTKFEKDAPVPAEFKMQSEKLKINSKHSYFTFFIFNF